MLYIFTIWTTPLIFHCITYTHMYVNSYSTIWIIPSACIGAFFLFLENKAPHTHTVPLDCIIKWVLFVYSGAAAACNKFGIKVHTIFSYIANYLSVRVVSTRTRSENNIGKTHTTHTLLEKLCVATLRAQYNALNKLWTTHAASAARLLRSFPWAMSLTGSKVFYYLYEYIYMTLATDCTLWTSLAVYFGVPIPYVCWTMVMVQ